MRSIAEFLEAVSAGRRDFERNWKASGEASSDFESTAYFAKVARDNGYIEDTDFATLPDGELQSVHVGKLTALGRAWLSIARSRRP